MNEETEIHQDVTFDRQSLFWRFLCSLYKYNISFLPVSSYPFSVSLTGFANSQPITPPKLPKSWKLAPISSGTLDKAVYVRPSLVCT